jgi:hypothetical protein
VSGTWARREAGGAAGDAATASGGDVQLGQEAADVAERGGASAGAGSGGAEARATRARAQRNAGAAEAVHMAGQWRRRAAEEKQRRERER